MSNKNNSIAWFIAISGITLEIFIATLDLWFDGLPHYAIHIGDVVNLARK